MHTPGQHCIVRLTPAAPPSSHRQADGPVCVVVLRRPGCLLCREEAVKVWADREAFAAAGVRLVCLVHEWIDREIAAFAPEYWGEPGCRSRCLCGGGAGQRAGGRRAARPARLQRQDRGGPCLPPPTHPP